MAQKALEPSRAEADASPFAPSSKVVLMYNTDDFMLPQLNVGSSGLQAVGGLTREAGLQVSRFPRALAFTEAFADDDIRCSFSPTTLSTRVRSASLSLPALFRLLVLVLSPELPTSRREVSCRKAGSLLCSLPGADLDASQFVLWLRSDQRALRPAFVHCARSQHSLDCFARLRWSRHHAWNEFRCSLRR